MLKMHIYEVVELDLNTGSLAQDCVFNTHILPFLGYIYMCVCTHAHEYIYIYISIISSHIHKKLLTVVTSEEQNLGLD